MQKIGIFGGTFSPPHTGHISAAKAFWNQIMLDRLIIMPTFIPPHKEMHKIEPEHRLNMAKLAFSSKQGFDSSVTVSDFELKKEGISYTFETLEHFSAPGTKLYFLCGTDMFLTLDEWKNPKRIFELSAIVLALREDITEEIESEIQKMKRYFEEKYDAEIIFIKNEPIKISSSELRKKCSLGEDLSEFLAPDVCTYIEKKELYRNDD